MRFERLCIPAFGPFTDLDIKFPAANGDLHVIYGPNEAGKSSLLRAFRDLLFGIHGQSPDNFLHDYKKLRIQGEIANRAGGRLVFQRRKGNKNTLLDADGNALAESTLAGFLGGVDQAYFCAMFGLSTRELRDGAEQLLSGKGELGTTLFSAGMGGTPVQQVLTELSGEAEALFKGRASSATIRRLVNEYKDLMRQSKESTVAPEVWDKLERELVANETARQKVEDNIAVLTTKLEWIIRCEDALPTVGQYDEQRRRLEALPSLPDVSSDFVERARAARKTLREVTGEESRLRDHIARLEAKLNDCQTSPRVLAEADVLDRLHQELGAYTTRRNALADLETERAGLQETLRIGMRKLDLSGDVSSVETLRINSATRLACEEAADALSKAVEERDKNSQKTEELGTRIKGLTRQLDALPERDLTDLRDALSIGAAATEANRALTAREAEVQRLAREVQDCHRELAGAPADLDATANLSVPTKASIRRAGGEMDELNRAIKTEEDKIVEGKRRIETIQAELARAERRGKLPTIDTLTEARTHRQHGWELVLADWKGGGATEELVPGTPLEQAYPEAVAAADEIADTLREEAEAVAQAEEKRFQIAKSEKQNGEAAEKIDKLRKKLEKHHEAWETAWQPCGVKPEAPALMEEWREAWSRFKDLLRRLRSAEETFRQATSQVENARAVLAKVLSEPPHKEFTVLFEEAKRRVQEGEQAAGRRSEIADRLQALKIQQEPLDQENARLASEVESTQKKWVEQCVPIGMPESITPKSGLSLLQERERLLECFDNWKETCAKSKHLVETIREYESEVSRKADALGVQADSIEAREAGLWKGLSAARTEQARYEQLDSQLQEARSDLEECRLRLEQATQALRELLDLAKVESAEALEPLLANLEARDDAHKQLATIRSTLTGLARGQTVDDFLARIKAEDVDALSQDRTALQARKDEKEAELQTVRDTLAELKKQRETLEAAGDAAADNRQKAESCAAQIKQEAGLFVRLRLAAHFLQSQVERFRKENQGPLLARSGHVFQNITCHAFSGLAAEFNADDMPVLVGVRPDKSTVPVAGMSDGTRDQLYLALRLAALDQHLTKKEPMPLILDDLLITFDDKRASAILPQLLELARRTQILLFTHHNHLVGLCKKVLGEEKLHLHELRISP